MLALEVNERKEEEKSEGEWCFELDQQHFSLCLHIIIIYPQGFIYCVFKTAPCKGIILLHTGSETGGAVFKHPLNSTCFIH